MGHQALQQRPDGLGAEDHGFDQSTGVQQAVGEDVAAIGVGAKLDFVHRQELGLAIQRHRLHGAGEPARFRRDDLLFAGDQGNRTNALAGNHAVIVLAGQQAEGEADYAGRVARTLNREMGLAGVGGAEHGPDARVEAGHAEMFGVPAGGMQARAEDRKAGVRSIRAVMRVRTLKKRTAAGKFGPDLCGRRRIGAADLPGAQSGRNIGCRLRLPCLKEQEVGSRGQVANHTQRAANGLGAGKLRRIDCSHRLLVSCSVVLLDHAFRRTQLAGSPECRHPVLGSAS